MYNESYAINFVQDKMIYCTRIYGEYNALRNLTKLFETHHACSCFIERWVEICILLKYPTWQPHIISSSTSVCGAVSNLCVVFEFPHVSIIQMFKSIMLYVSLCASSAHLVLKNAINCIALQSHFSAIVETLRYIDNNQHEWNSVVQL